MSGDFCHLHTHTQYSLLDGASRISGLIERAQALGQRALAITDHGNMFGAIEFYQACQAATKAAQRKGKPGLKPVLGMEAYIVPEGASRTSREKIGGAYDHHCLLWAATNEGYRNLMKLSSAAYAEGFYMHPRIDLELLAEHAGGLIGSSGCLSSEIPHAILRKDHAAARALAGRYQEILGKKNFYFELQNQCGALAPARFGEAAQELAQYQKKVNAAVLKLAKELGGKVIATNDSHYTQRGDAEAHDALLCIGTGKRIADAKRLKFAADEFYLKSGQEMQALFPGHPETLIDTMEVAERCNVKLTFGEYHFPNFPLPEGEEETAFFRVRVEEGLRKRYGDPPPPEVRARAAEELRVLEKMGFVGYLLIVWDITREARARGIPVGPGRGSAAGSIVTYALGITNLDPLKYHLLFERFVNEGRNEMPDIDIDFCQSRRGEIIAYVQDRYGRDCTAGIITFNSMAAKGSIRDVGRVLDWPLGDVDRIAKLVPGGPGVTLEGALQSEPELKERYEQDDATRRLIDLARKIEGLARNPGRHAAGLVVADKPITEYCPLYRDKDGALLTQYEMSHIDAVGLLKIDILGLQNLTILDRAVRFIRERHGVEINLDQLPLDDKPTFQMLHRGEAKGIFQFESEGMVKLLMEARPDCLEDMIALNAMYRPGPMKNIPSFVSRKHGLEPIDYLLPELEPILKETYGIIVYQEQVMQIAHRIAGFSLSDADRLRKAMGKKKKELMRQYGMQFVRGCEKNGIPREKAQILYDLIAEFASYGFNKSHSAAYAFVAYQTAYLKAHYPAEYMAALLSLNQGHTDDVVAYIEEARRIGLEILGPDVNRSEGHFSIEDDTHLRFSLAAIKGVGGKAVETIVAARREGGAFRELYDFCERVDSKSANKGCLESLIRAGAFDALAGPGGRGQLLAALEDAMRQGAALRRDRESGQGSLFGEMDGGTASRPPLPPVPAWPEKQRLEEEKKVLGFFFSGHPLAGHRELIEGLSSRSCQGLADVKEGYEVLLGAYVNAVRLKQTRNGGKRMAVLNVEDFSGGLQVVVFPRTYERCKDRIRSDGVLYVRGRVKHSEIGAQAVSLVAEELLTIEEAVKRFLSGIQITLRQDGASFAGPRERGEPSTGGASGKGNGKNAHALATRLESLAELLKAYPGPSPVQFRIELEEGPGAPASVRVMAGDEWGVRACPELFAALRQLLPRGAVRVCAEGIRARRPAEPHWRRQARPVHA